MKTVRVLMVSVGLGMALTLVGCAKEAPGKPEPTPAPVVTAPVVTVPVVRAAPAEAAQPQPVKPQPVKAGALSSADFERVYFASNHFGVRQPYRGALREAADRLKAHPDQGVEVAGYTDEQGDAVYNRHLSQRRAEEVRDILVGHGVSRKQLRAKGYGESQPAAKGKGEKALSQNRRVEIHVP